MGTGVIDRHGNDIRRSAKAWRLARDVGVDRCCYCRRPFDMERPPTRDHVVPVSAGGTLNDGVVLACQSCNAARGACPYDVYASACRWEWVLSFLEDREWRRPKWRQQYRTLSTLPDWAWDVVPL